jgi:hypothetical protein
MAKTSSAFPSFTNARSSSTSNVKVLCLALVPLVLVGLLSWGFVSFPQAGGALLKEGKTYAVWVKELEVDPKRSDGRSWDFDGSAPDLAVAIGWQGHELLRTTVADNSVLATWDPVALKVSTLLKGEVSRGEAQRLAKFRVQKGMEMVLGVYDHDLVDAEPIASTRLKVDQLVFGLNQLASGKGVRRLILAVEEVDQVGTPQPNEGDPLLVEWSMENPVELAGSARLFGEQTQQLLQGLSEEMSLTFEDLSEEYQKQIEELALQLQEELKTARIDVEQATKTLEQELRKLRKSLKAELPK